MANLLEEELFDVFEQLLQRCDRNNLPALGNKIKAGLAHLHRALNSGHAPILKLPTELIVEIGKHVLGFVCSNRDKS